MKYTSFASSGPLRTVVWQTLLVSLLPLCVLAAVAVTVSERVMEDRFRDETNLAASIALDAIEQKESLALRGAWLVAGLADTRTLVESRNSAALTGFLVPLKSCLSVDEINVSGMDGMIFASAQDEDQTMIDASLASSSASPSQSWALVDNPGDQDGLTLRAVAIVRTETGVPIGLIQVGVILGPEFLQTVKGDSGLELLIATHRGVRSSTLTGDFTDVPSLEEVQQASTPRLARVINTEGANWEGSFTPIESRGLEAVIGVLVSRQPLEAATRSLLRIVAILGVALSVGVVLVSYRIGQAITEPLQRLTTTAAQIQAGDLAARVDERSKNELRRLEVGFNGMADSLERFSRNMEGLVEQRTRRLAALHDLGTDLARESTMEALPGLLRRSAQLTKSVLDLDHAAVLQLLPDLQTAVVHQADSEDGSLPAEIKLDPASATLRALSVDGPVLIRDIAEHEDLKLLVWPGMVSSASVVVPGQDRAFGVLTAQAGFAHEFQTDEVEFVQSVANAIGQAIERIQAIDNLREEHARTEHLLASIPSVLVGVDVWGRVQLWNHAAEEVFDIPATAALRLPLEAQQLKWRADEIDAAVRECVRAGGAVHLEEVRYERPSGGERYLTLTLTPVLDDDGLYSGYLMIGVDVTDRRSLQDQLNQAQRLEAIGRLAAGIAHEINTPTQYVGDNVRFLADAFRDVNGLLVTYTELIRRVGAGAEADQIVQEAESAASAVDVEFLSTEIPEAISQSLEGIDRVASIVRAMKEFSHPGATEAMPADLNHALETTIAVSRNEWKYVAQVVTDFDESLPPVTCLPGQLNQALLNIVVNAAHAIGEAGASESGTLGTITVSSRRDGNVAEIRITDTGNGIPEHIRGQIFDPFFTTKGVGRGTGQGLAIARSIVVEKHDGEIRFESTIGVGTCFIIRLPIDGPHVVEIAA